MTERPATPSAPHAIDTFELLRARPDDPPNIRALRFAVIAMGLLLVAGLVAVVARIVYLMNRPPAAPASDVPIPMGGSDRAPRPSAEVSLALPPGAKVRSQSLSGNRLAVHYDGTSEGILVLDLETGQTLSHVHLTGPR